MFTNRRFNSRNNAKMGSKKITEDTYTRHLPFSVAQRLSSMLDPGRLWEKVVVNIPKKLNMLDRGSHEFEPKFSHSFIAMVEMNGRKPGCSCSRMIFDEWSTQNSRVKHLLKVLTMSEVYAAADYIAVDVLKGDPVPRSSTEDFTPTGKENKSPVTSENTDKFCEKETLYKRKQNCECAMSEMQGSSSGLALNISHASGLPSADLKGGNSMGSCRVASESDEVEDAESLFKSIIEDDGIRLRRLDFKLLKHITNNFDVAELSKGGNLIGRGGFGTVFLGQFSTGFKIAVKCLKEENDDNLKQFTTELEVLAKYRHVNIVHLLGYSQEDSNHCLIYQYMPNGSLEDRLACKNRTAPLNCQQRLDIAKGTARGIEYLNSQGVVHRDIKSANVLLDVDFVPKVGDFATARTAPKGIGTSCVQTNIVIGTSAYLAPEAYQFDVSAKLDSYSFGVVLLELLTGLPPYDDKREEKDIKSHMDENCEDIMDMVDTAAGSWKEETALAMFDIANRCLQNRKRRRPLIENILPDLEELSNEKQV